MLPGRFTTPDADDRSLYGLGYEPVSPPNVDKPAFVTSLPKSGTHIIRNVLVAVFGASQVSSLIMAIPNEPAPPKVYAGHLWRDTPSDHPYVDRLKRLIFVRDPRGYVLSYTRFLRQAGVQPGTYPFWEEIVTTFPSDDALIDAMLDGYVSRHTEDRLPGIVESYSAFALHWLSAPGYKLVRYEDLFEPGTKLLNVPFMKEIAAYLGVDDVDGARLIAAADPAYASSYTPAAIDEWRRTLSSEQEQRVWNAAAVIAQRFNYSR